ncbi:MAG: heterodisulfide reductase subunit F, partial [Thermoplasmata archaeon]|nr:heterodisulfide reductase subunit F [Thermoplasmata archaeon]
LDRLGWRPGQIYTTLENRMKCGIGKCGRCNIGDVYVCKHGPVFTYEQVKGMVPEF